MPDLPQLDQWKTVLGIAAALLGAGIWLGNLTTRIGSLEDNLGGPLPQRAVVAFNGACPDGWKPFVAARGRFILGAGEGNGLKPRSLGDSGGKEAVPLTLEEIPHHVHDVGIGTSDSYGLVVNGNRRLAHFGERDPHNKPPAPTTGPAGEPSPSPHDNMPPFTVLTYCEKE